MNVEMSVEEFNRQYRPGAADLKLPAEKPNRKVTKQDRVKLEDAFLAAWRCVAKDLPEPERQYRFCTRMWRFDYAWPDSRVAVEIQGGSFVKGAHNRGASQAKDFDKLNRAAGHGWTVLQFNTKQMGDPYKVAAEVAEVLRERLKK